MKANKLEKPQKTFFFEREDGSVIAVGEYEAWNLLKNRNQIIGVRTYPPKLLGVSNGQKMYEAVKEAHAIYLTDQELAKDRMRRGFDEELEVARGNIVQPRNPDKQGDGAYLI